MKKCDLVGRGSAGRDRGVCANLHPPSHQPPERDQIAFLGPEFVLALAKIWRLVVQIKAIEIGDLVGRGSAGRDRCVCSHLHPPLESNPQHRRLRGRTEDGIKSSFLDSRFVLVLAQIRRRVVSNRRNRKM